MEPRMGAHSRRASQVPVVHKRWRLSWGVLRWRHQYREGCLFPRLALSVTVGRQSQSSFHNMTVHPNGAFHALAGKNGMTLWYNFITGIKPIPITNWQNKRFGPMFILLFRIFSPTRRTGCKFQANRRLKRIMDWSVDLFINLTVLENSWEHSELFRTFNDSWESYRTWKNVGIPLTSFLSTLSKLWSLQLVGNCSQIV